MIFFDIIREIAYLCNIIQLGLFASWFPLAFSYRSVSSPLVSLTVAKGNKGFAKGMMGEWKEICNFAAGWPQADLLVKLKTTEKRTLKQLEKRT